MSEENMPAVMETILPDVDTKKTRMANVRDAKKRKQVDRDDTISEMKKSISEMVSLMKPTEDTPTDTPADRVNNSPVPCVVTIDDDMPVSNGSGMRVEICRTLTVSILGLGIWYVNNIWNKKKTETIKPVAKPSFIHKKQDFDMPPLPKKQKVVLSCGLLS